MYECTSWDGVTTRDAYREDITAGRDRLADAARGGDWAQVFDLLQAQPDWINGHRIGGPSHYTPLHCAAWQGADLATAERLLDLGAWRTVTAAGGERAVDIAEARGHGQLLPLLRPQPRHPLPGAAVTALERHFHSLIEKRSHELVARYRLRLPQVAVLTELSVPRMSFSVPGMYGGFYYELRGEELLVESWSRIAGGSGQRHRITVHGTTLVDEGFV